MGRLVDRSVGNGTNVMTVRGVASMSLRKNLKKYAKGKRVLLRTAGNRKMKTFSPTAATAAASLVATRPVLVLVVVVVVVADPYLHNGWANRYAYVALRTPNASQGAAYQVELYPCEYSRPTNTREIWGEKARVLASISGFF